MPNDFTFSYHISSSGDSKKDQLPEEPSIQFIRAIDAGNLSLDYTQENEQTWPYKNRFFITKLFLASKSPDSPLYFSLSRVTKNQTSDESLHSKF